MMRARLPVFCCCALPAQSLALLAGRACPCCCTGTAAARSVAAQTLTKLNLILTNPHPVCSLPGACAGPSRHARPPAPVLQGVGGGPASGVQGAARQPGAQQSAGGEGDLKIGANGRGSVEGRRVCMTPARAASATGAGFFTPCGSNPPLHLHTLLLRRSCCA